MAGQLTPDEAKYYRGVFVTLDWLNNKQIPANPQLKLLLTASRLPVATLGQLWTLSYALATNNKRDWLTDRDLCIVLRLISVAQSGQTPSYEAIKAPNLPLPKIDINMLREAHKKAIEEGKVPAPSAAPAPAAAEQAPAAASTAQPPAQATPAAAAQAAPPVAAAAAAAAAQAAPAAQAAAGQATPAAGTIDWTMSDKQKQDYTRSFDQLDPNKTGIISAVDAVGFLRKSKLPENILREIWKLSDLGRDGALDLTEFCIAMHLVLKARSNIPIPPTLPPVLLPAKFAADAEQKVNALKEQQAKEQQAKEQQAKEQQAKEQQAKEQQAKEQQAKEQQEKERQAKEQQEKEQQEKEQKEQELKQQQAKEAELKEQQQKEQEAKEKQEKEKEELERQQKEQAVNGEKVSEVKAEASNEEPPKSKFATKSITPAATPAASPAPAQPSGRSREAKPAEERQRSPKPRAVSPSPRTAVAATDNTSTGLPPTPVAPLPGKKQEFGVSSRVASSPAPVKNPDAPKGAKAVAVRAWLEALLNEKIPVSISLGEALKSGVRLCKTINVIEPDSVLDISLNQFMRRENILAFLDALRKKGFKPDKLFLVDELFEMQNIDAVIDTMIHLDAYAGKIKFEGPRLKL